MDACETPPHRARCLVAEREAWVPRRKALAAGFDANGFHHGPGADVLTSLEGA